MSDWKLQFYHKSPPILRNALATIRGYQLKYWRYGRDTERLIEDALQRDSWSPEKLKEYQESKLAAVLHRAATSVPYYREYWTERRRRGDYASWEDLGNWPILKKAALQENTLAFVADDCDVKGMYIDNTSGTTGTPLKLYISRGNLHHWYALFEARWRRWYGLSIKENWAILGGQPVIPISANRPPFWVWNSALNQLYLSANHISHSNTPAYIQALQNYEITHLVVYTSSATYLAEQINRLSLKTEFPKLKAILTNAEPLFEWQRNILTNAFECPVYETYGLAEAVVAASVDNKHRLRLWPEPGYLEILDDRVDTRLEVGEVGRIVSTSLLNSDMPLIRYEIGDRSGFSSEKPDESDSIQLTPLLSIHGRNSDMLVAEDGRHIFWVNPVFYGLPVAEAQIVQESLRHITVKVVPSHGFGDIEESEVKARLIARLGDVAITVEKMVKIPRGPGGKFRPVMSNLSPEERERFAK